MFDSKDTATEFLKYLNSRHNSIKFTIEFEQAKQIPFLDIKTLPKQHFHHICLPEEDIHWTLYQMGFIYTTQVQNQPHPHAHVSIFSYLLHRFIAKICCRGSQKAFATKWLPSRHHHF